METTEQNTTAPITAPATKDTGPQVSTLAPFVPKRSGGRPMGRGGRPGGRRDGRGSRPEKPKSEYEQKMLSIRRVTRVMSGGRRFSFSVVLAIGNKKGTIGLGIGKANDTTLAIQKAFNDAKKHLLKLRLTDRGTISHDVTAKYKAARVMLMPNRGRGIVVGSAMRVMVELAGIKDITGRVMSGSKDKLTIAQATMKALSGFKINANK